METIIYEEEEVLNQPNTALLCTFLMIGTFVIAYFLRLFRNSKYLGRTARRTLGDFGVPIAIVFMVLVDFLLNDIYTKKLSVPEGLEPSNAEVRGWFISPGGTRETIPVWLPFAAFLPALLFYILVFMETQICELIVNSKDRKLKKGSGFHLDVVLLCVINALLSLIGGPWQNAATVRAITHVAALSVMSTTHAPGETPKLIEVKEQRFTNLMVSSLVGISIAMSPVLRLVPLAVIFGVFLYMGVSSMNGIQFFERLGLFFEHVKHHPHVPYVRKVRTLKMHMFTGIQLICLCILWIVKSTAIALAFPFFLLLMVPLRFQLKYIFTEQELEALDCEAAETETQEDEPDFHVEARLAG